MSFSFDETTKSFGYDSKKFEKFDIIGKGSYGKVKLAHYDGDKSTIFAIKKMIAKKGSKEEKISENEIQILEKLSKFEKPLSFFPKYYGYTRKIKENKIKYHIFLEYFPYTLDNLLEKDISFEIMKSIIYQLIDGLAFLQTLGLCHRDIKTANILYEESNNEIKIKIIDFGTSKENVRFIDQNMTITGTPCYFSPELFVKYYFDKGIKLNPYKSDVFSLGLTIIQIITKKQKIFQINECDTKNDFFEDVEQQIYKILKKVKKKIDIEKENRENFFELIRSMLEINFRCRPDFIDLLIKSINKEDFTMEKLQNLISFKQNSYELNKKEINNFDLNNKKKQINEPNNKKISLYLHNLLSDKKEIDIFNSFQKFLKYGKIKGIKISQPNNQFPTNYCFINFSDENDCSNALENAKKDKEVQNLFRNKECFIVFQRINKNENKKILHEEEKKEQIDYFNLECQKISNFILETAEKKNIKITKKIADNIVRKYDHDLLNDTLKKIKNESNYQNFLEIVKKEQNRLNLKKIDEE